MEKSSRFERELKEKDDKMQQQKQKIDTYQSRLCKAEQRVEQLENELTIKQRELREQKQLLGVYDLLQRNLDQIVAENVKVLRH